MEEIKNPIAAGNIAFMAFYELFFQKCHAHISSWYLPIGNQMLYAMTTGLIQQSYSPESQPYPGLY